MGNRRRLLTSCGGLALSILTGCLGAPSDTPGEEGTEQRGREISLTAVRGDPAETGFEFEIEVLSSALTPETLPELEVRIHNRDDVAFVYSGRGRVFDAMVSTPGGLYLLTESERVQLETNLADRVHSEMCLTMEPVPRPDQLVYTELEPDEHRSERYAVVGDHEALDADCPPPGEYEFSDTYLVAESTGDDVSPEAEFEFEFEFDWGFTLELLER